MKTFKDLEFKPHPVGIGLMSRAQFDNGWGISVVRFTIGIGGYGSYTDDETEWEAAVLKNNSLCYDSGLTEDVMGHLKEDDVTELMRKIQELPDCKESA